MWETLVGRHRDWGHNMGRVPLPLPCEAPDAEFGRRLIEPQQPRPSHRFDFTGALEPRAAASPTNARRERRPADSGREKVALACSLLP